MSYQKSRMHAVVSNFHDKRFTTFRKNFREMSRLMFFREIKQGTIYFANPRKGENYRKCRIKKTSKTTIMMYDDEIPESNL